MVDDHDGVACFGAPWFLAPDWLCLHIRTNLRVQLLTVVNPGRRGRRKVLVSFRIPAEAATLDVTAMRKPPYIRCARLRSRMRPSRVPHGWGGRTSALPSDLIEECHSPAARRLLNLVSLFSAGELSRLTVRVVRDDGTWEDLELSGHDQEERDASLLRLLQASRG